MPSKKITFLTIVFLIPSFVSFIMCPVAHSFTASKCQQLLIGQQQFQKNNCQQKEHTSVPLWSLSGIPSNLQAYYKAIANSPQPLLDQELANKLTLLKTIRLNI